MVNTVVNFVVDSRRGSPTREGHEHRFNVSLSKESTHKIHEARVQARPKRRVRDLSWECLRHILTLH